MHFFPKCYFFTVVRNAVHNVNSSIQSGGKTSMLRALQDEDGRFSDINPQNMQWYLDILAKALRDKAETEVRQK